MNTIEILKEAYGYDSPIFLKRVRIGGKSKTAIRQDLSRAFKKGEINKISNGVYFFGSDEEVTRKYYLDMIEKKYIKNNYGYTHKDIDIYGYYTGKKYLEILGMLKLKNDEVIEIITNKTSSKRKLKYGDINIIIRKGKTAVDKASYKALQFLDMFYILNEEEIEKNRDLILTYLKDNISLEEIEKYISLYPKRIEKIIKKSGLLDELV